MTALDDPAQRGDVPSVDLAGHVRELGRALLPALVIALLVGGAVFWLRSALSAKEYEASVITQITPAQQLVPGDAFIEQMRAPFMGLAQDTTVLNQTLSEVDTDWDADTLRDHVSLTPGPSPQLLVFTVTANSPEMAEQLARSMVVSVARASFANHARDIGRRVEELQAAVAAEQARNATLAPEDPAKIESDQQLADLNAQLAAMHVSSGDQLTILSTPEQDPKPVSPQPLSEALVAGVVALIVAAEAIVLLRGRIGRKPNRAWARRTAHRYHARFDAGVIGDGTLSPLAAATLAQNQLAGRKVVVLLGEKTDPPEHVGPASTTSDVTSNGHGPRPPGLVQWATLDGSWWQDIYVGTVAAVIVIVSKSGSDRKAAERALRQLADLRVSTHLVLQNATRRQHVSPAEPPVPENRFERGRSSRTRPVDHHAR